MPIPDRHFVNGAPLDGKFPGLELAMFGMGCFWGAETKFWEAEGGGAIALVAHGDPLRALLSVLMGLPLSMVRSFTVSTGSISIVRYDTWRTRVALLNWRPGGVERSLED
jgi:hypothetical protein